MRKSFRNSCENFSLAKKMRRRRRRKTKKKKNKEKEEDEKEENIKKLGVEGEAEVMSW